MSKFPIDSVGAAWLADNYEVYPIAHWHVRSQIGTRRITQIVDGKKVEIYPESMRPINEPFAHLQFHLRHWSQWCVPSLWFHRCICTL